MCTAESEQTMLGGFLVIAKFLIIKLFLHSGKYSYTMAGVSFTESQTLNLKMIGTLILHALRQFTDEIDIKKKNPINDSDGGIQKVLYNPNVVIEYCLGKQNHQLLEDLREALLKLTSKVIYEGSK